MALPATVEVGFAVTEKWLVALSAMGADVPVMDGFAASVAVTVSAPAEFRVTLKVPVESKSAELAGNDASPSLLLKPTVPE
jgi:hypothetical protein